jgi:hypothetical protein
MNTTFFLLWSPTCFWRFGPRAKQGMQPLFADEVRPCSIYGAAFLEVDGPQWQRHTSKISHTICEGDCARTLVANFGPHASLDHPSQYAHFNGCTVSRRAVHSVSGRSSSSMSSMSSHIS